MTSRRYIMKKLITLSLTMLMVLCFSFTVSAVKPETTNHLTNYYKNIQCASVQPRTMEILYSFNSTIGSSFEGNFRLSSTRNLKILFKATSDCTIMFYKGNSVFPFKTLKLAGGPSVVTYDIANNCTAGNYSFIITSNNQNCQAIFNIVSTQYA